MHLDPFELHRPTTVEEAVALARRHAGAVDFLAGGTDLLPNYKMHLNLRPHVISLDGIPELADRTPERVGVMTRLADLEQDRSFRSAYPGIAAAVDEVATPLVRASATVGGNLMVETRCFFFNQSYFWRESLGFCLKADGTACHVVPQTTKCYATFSGDLAPAFGALGAEIEVASMEGRRRFPLLELYDAAGDGIRRNSLHPGELLVAVHLPPTARGLTATYRKLRVRPSFDFPELGLAAAARWESDTLRSLTIVAGGLE
ncbi:MAG: FAD binding domain-containing protein, partial [Thermoplasmata archaeon]